MVLKYDAEDEDRLTPFKDDKLKVCKFIKFKAYGIRLTCAYVKTAALNLLHKAIEKQGDFPLTVRAVSLQWCVHLMQQSF